MRHGDPPSLLSGWPRIAFRLAETVLNDPQAADSEARKVMMQCVRHLQRVADRKSVV